MSELSCPHTSLELEIVALMPALRAFASRFVSSSSDADDLAQEAICRALRKIDDFCPGTSMKSWLFTIIRNIYCSGYRRAVRERCGKIADVAVINVPMAAGQEWTLRAIDADAAIQRLSSTERRALLLVANGTSYADAAASCQCKIGTIKSRVSRARLHLVSMLGDLDPFEAASIN